MISFRLLLGDFAFHEHASAVHEDPDAALAAHQSLEAALVANVLCVGKRLRSPRQVRDAVLNGRGEHIAVSQARQVEVAGEIIGQLLYAHGVAPPQGHAIEFHA